MLRLRRRIAGKITTALTDAAASDLQLSKRQLPRLRSNAWFWHFFVLVLSIAVLVLVIDPPLIASMAMKPCQQTRGIKRIRDVFNRKAINIKSIMAKQVVCHGCRYSITSTSTVSLSTSTRIAFECQND